MTTLPPGTRSVIETLTHHPSKRVWKLAQDLGNALNLWPAEYDDDPEDSDEEMERREARAQRAAQG